MAVQVDNKNTLGDISRLLRVLWTYAVFFALGFLFCNFVYGKQSVIQNPSNYNITCTVPSAKIVFVIMPANLPNTGAE